MNAEPSCKRGVYVTPPSTSTSFDHETPKLIRSSFDTLELAYHASLPNEFLKRLSCAKRDAQETREAVAIRYNGLEFLVEGSGGQGGYQYRIDTGRFEAIWKFKENSQKDPWSAHAKLRSYGLSTKPLVQAKHDADAFLLRIGARFDPDNARVGRADFAADIYAPSLKVNPAHFICHARTNKTEDTSTTTQGGIVRSVRIGSMPGWQLAVYNKSIQVKTKRDHIWAQILTQCSKCENIPYKGERGGSSIKIPNHIWRIEGRVARNAIDTLAKPRRWDIFLSVIDQLPRFFYSKVCWSIPTSDSNRSRWPTHPAWSIFIDALRSHHIATPSAPVPLEALARLREEFISTLDRQIDGLIISKAAANGVKRAHMRDHMKLDAIARIGRITSNTNLAEQLDDKKDRINQIYGSSPRGK